MTSLLLALALLTLLQAALAAATACTSSLDCQLNGACTRGKCVCDKGWSGDSCGLLHLDPAAHVACMFTTSNHLTAT